MNLVALNVFKMIDVPQLKCVIQLFFILESESASWPFGLSTYKALLWQGQFLTGWLIGLNFIKMYKNVSNLRVINNCNSKFNSIVTVISKKS